MYPESLVAPMKRELTGVGFVELTTAEEVENFLDNDEGTTLIMVNSVCGCAAANARPAVKMSIQYHKSPNQMATVFAGVDTEAVAKAREYMLPYPPSSPSIALFKNGKLVYFVERHQIEGRPAELIAEGLVQAYEQYCD